MNSENELWKRRPPSRRNILWKLRQRELHPYRPGTLALEVRRFALNIYPNYSLMNVHRPPIWPRKFSPNGNLFIGTSDDLSTLMVYDYRGAAAGESLLRAGDDARVPDRIFSCFFRVKWEITLTSHRLCQECSLFTDDSRFLIVASCSEEPIEAHMFDTYRHNETLELPIYIYPRCTVHVVDLQTGEETDRHDFCHDRINFRHNQDIYLYRRTIVVFSLPHQTLHVFQLTEEGKLVEIRMIGRFCREDDELVWQQACYEQAPATTVMPDQRTSQPYRAFMENSLSGLKQRLLSFLYRRAQRSGNPTQLSHYWRHFEYIKELRIWKFQMLDEQHLVLRYALPKVIWESETYKEKPGPPCVFVIYNMVTTEISAVYENSSDYLMSLLTSFNDLFHQGCLHANSQLVSSPSNNIHARSQFARLFQMHSKTKNGGVTNATRRLLCCLLPIYAQSYTTSPYLDCSLFSYEERYLSPFERPKRSQGGAISFFCRETGVFRFSLQTKRMEHHPHQAHATPLVNFIFHPTEPFAVSVQRINEFVVNFHVHFKDAPSDIV